jgi:hypothetical protein
MVPNSSIPQLGGAPRRLDSAEALEVKLAGRSPAWALEDPGETELRVGRIGIADLQAEHAGTLVAASFGEVGQLQAEARRGPLVDVQDEPSAV